MTGISKHEKKKTDPHSGYEDINLTINMEDTTYKGGRCYMTSSSDIGRNFNKNFKIFKEHSS